MAESKLIAEWDTHGYRVKLFRRPIVVGQSGEYNLIAIDSGNVRRVDLDLMHRNGLDQNVPAEHRWMLDNAPATAWRILNRFVGVL